MLQDGHSYAKLPAIDFDRARRFNVDTLGFQPTWEGPGYVRFECGGGSSFLVFASSGKVSGDHDQCGWVVDDIESEVTELRRRGVILEEFAGATFIDGIRDDPAGRSAWFRDSEGNLLNFGATLRAVDRRDEASPAIPPVREASRATATGGANEPNGTPGGEPDLASLGNLTPGGLPPAAGCPYAPIRNAGPGTFVLLDASPGGDSRREPGTYSIRARQAWSAQEHRAR